jgi:hypothetical protein
MSNLPFEPVEDLLIGHIVEVSGTSIRIELDGAVSELNKSYQGRIYPIGQMGSAVKIHFGRRVIFGFVTMLRMRSEEIIAADRVIPPEADQRIMEVELFAEGTWNGINDTLSFSRGVATYPLPRQGVYLLTRDEAGILYKSAEARVADGHSPMVPFGRYVGADSSECRANIDKMFGMHCAVLGSTGSGKSGAVAAVLHSVLEYTPAEGIVTHPRIIIIDPHGEYGAAFGVRSIVYRAYDPIGNDETIGTPISLPFWLMSADEFRLLVIGKTEHEATSQHNIVYKALAHARMVAAGLAKSAPTAFGVPDPNPAGALDEPVPVAGKTLDELADFDLDKPRKFSLDEFYNHIRFLQAAKVKGGVTEKITDTDFQKSYKSILDKLAVLRRDPRIDFLMKPAEVTLEEIISQFVGTLQGGDATRDLRIIDISGLPNEVAGPLAALIARLLFQYKLYQTQQERAQDPILLVCEEAHRYVPDRGEAEYSASQSAIRRIAREGRKYGIGLMLVSQRPADVESTVISQCGTWLILRLTNAADQQHVARFLPDGLSGMVRALPALAQQEALFVGEGAALPARVRIRDLPKNKLPRSANVSFVNGWARERLTIEQIASVSRRMDTEVIKQPAAASQNGDVPP